MSYLSAALRSRSDLSGRSLTLQPMKIWGTSPKKEILNSFTCRCRHTAPCPWQCWSPGPGWWSRCSCSPSYRAGTLPGTQKTWKPHGSPTHCSFKWLLSLMLSLFHSIKTHLALRMALWHSSIFPSHLIFTSVKVDLSKWLSYLSQAAPLETLKTHESRSRSKSATSFPLSSRFTTGLEAWSKA